MGDIPPVVDNEAASRFELAIGGHRFARLHQHAVVRREQRDRHRVVLEAFGLPQAMGAARHEAREMLQRLPRPRAREELQVAPAQQQEDEHRHRIEVDVALARHRGPRARDEGDAEAQGDGHVHAGTLQSQVAPGAALLSTSTRSRRPMW